MKVKKMTKKQKGVSNNNFLTAWTLCNHIMYWLPPNVGLNDELNLVKKFMAPCSCRF